MRASSVMGFAIGWLIILQVYNAHLYPAKSSPPYVSAWVYPDASGALTDIAIEKPNAVRIEWLHVTDKGKVETINASEDLPNGYGADNLRNVNQASPTVLVTVSGDLTKKDKSANALVTDPVNRIQAVNDITRFVTSNHLAGAEIDFEPFSHWDKATTQGYTDFLTALATSLHQNGVRLEVDGPAIDSPAVAGLYSWQYDTLAPAGIDQFVIMAYDHQYDANEGPVAPDAWITDSITYAKKHIGSNSRIAVGLPAYGYMQKSGKISLLGASQRQLQFAKRHVDPNVAVRDSASQELTVNAPDGTVFWWPDQVTLQHQMELVRSSGIEEISVWYVGDKNPWPLPTPTNP